MIVPQGPVSPAVKVSAPTLICERVSSVPHALAGCPWKASRKRKGVQIDRDRRIERERGARMNMRCFIPSSAFRFVDPVLLWSGVFLEVAFSSLDVPFASAVLLVGVSLGFLLIGDDDRSCILILLSGAIPVELPASSGCGSGNPLRNPFLDATPAQVLHIMQSSSPGLSSGPSSSCIFLLHFPS